MGIVKHSVDQSNLLESPWFTVAIYGLCGAVVFTAWRSGDFSFQHLGLVGWVLTITAFVTAVFLFSVSVFELISYFVFIPSIKSDSHIFTRVHSAQMIHPLTSSMLLVTFLACVLSQSILAWSLWGMVLVAYVIQTSHIVRRIKSEEMSDPIDSVPQSMIGLLAHLILGSEVVTMAAGARAIAPWKIKGLPDDTWIVDVRTKSEFQWNRLYGAQNFPWGSGLIEASRSVPRDRPILVTCLSGHRSPAVAVMLKKLGFKNVYNLNWGLLYLILLERGKSGAGVFDLTRPNRNTSDRGRDYKGISYGYIICALIIIVMAPFESGHASRSVSDLQKIFGMFLGLTGLLTAWFAYRALGRNFRVFAAPRRSGTLIQSGVYSKVRHPMYTAVIVGFAGYVVFWGSYWAFPFWIALTGLYIVKAFKEEGVLAQRYPNYKEYVSRTKRFLPYLF